MRKLWDKLKEWVDEPAERASLAVNIVAVLLVAIGVIVAWLGFRFLHPEWTLKDLTTDFYANSAIDLISIGATVLIIDWLYARRSKLEEKQRNIEQLRSPSEGVAKEALRIITGKGWLRDGSLKGANLVGANLVRASLVGANLKGAHLEGAHLEGANLVGANLVGAHLEGTQLKGAHLGRAHLEGANLCYAHLGGASFGGAHLEGAHLEGANLDGADLVGANLVGANLKGATYNRYTTWPLGFAPVAAGAVLRK